jgi:hypothetical protein
MPTPAVCRVGAASRQAIAGKLASTRNPRRSGGFKLMSRIARTTLGRVCRHSVRRDLSRDDRRVEVRVVLQRAPTLGADQIPINRSACDNPVISS